MNKRNKELYFTYKVENTNEGDFMVKTSKEALSILNDFGNENSTVQKGKYTVINNKWVNVDLKYRVNKAVANLKTTLRCRVRNMLSPIMPTGHKLYFNDFVKHCTFNNCANRVIEQIQVKGLDYTQENYDLMEQEVFKMREEGKLTELFNLPQRKQQRQD